jgi:hypothetical protein
MYRIRLLKEGKIVETVEAEISDVAEIAHRATELEPRHGADDWEIVNGLGQRFVTKSRGKAFIASSTIGQRKRRR